MKTTKRKKTRRNPDSASQPVFHVARRLETFKITETVWRKIYPGVRKDVNESMKKSEIIGKMASTVIRELVRRGNQFAAEELDQDLLENVIQIQNEPLDD